MELFFFLLFSCVFSQICIKGEIKDCYGTNVDHQTKDVTFTVGAGIQHIKPVNDTYKTLCESEGIQNLYNLTLRIRLNYPPTLKNYDYIVEDVMILEDSNIKSLVQQIKDNNWVKVFEIVNGTDQLYYHFEYIHPFGEQFCYLEIVGYSCWVQHYDTKLLLARIGGILGGFVVGILCCFCCGMSFLFIGLIVSEVKDRRSNDV